MSAPEHIRNVRKKLKAFGCTCEHDDASKYLIDQPSTDVVPFYIEVSHGKNVRRDEVHRAYIQKIRRKLGISRKQWDRA